MSKGKILVVRGGAIGDFVLTLPVFAALRAQFPRARIEVLGYQHITQMARLGGMVDATRSIEARPMAYFFARKGDLDFDLSTYFAGFDIIISYLYDPDSIFRDNIGRISRAQFIQGPHRPDDIAGEHAAKSLLKPLERLAIFDADPRPVLSLPPARSPSAERLLALHPGSGSDRKNWPEPRWAELIVRLVESTSLRLLLVGGEAEEGRLGRLSGHAPAGRLEVARNLPLEDLAMKLRGCDAFVGHDSGITHLAAAVGLPGLALWGPTVESVWRPASDRFSILRSPGGIEGIRVEDVLNATLGLLSEQRTAGCSL